MVKKIAQVVASTTIHVVVFGLIGVMITFILSAAGEEGVVQYVLWAVIGIFCGLMSYSSGLETITGKPLRHWTYSKDTPRTGLVVVAIKLFTLIALSILYTRFVTESLSLAFTFFCSGISRRAVYGCLPSLPA
jgi:uncharacterized membrane protein YjfL (UPF0719 family)